MNQRRSFGVVIVAVALVFGGSCGSKKQGASQQAPAKIASTKDVPDGLALRLSDGQRGAPAYDRAKVAPATKLGAAEVTALLARGRPLAAEPTDRAAFAIRPGSQPPPRAGQTIMPPSAGGAGATTFPPAASTLTPPKPADASKDVRVLRWTPEGKVPIAPELSVTFSQPMVAVTSQADAAAVVPVTLTPTPKGRWRWIGTRTIVFDPEVRFPQATTYKVDVAAGTKSAAGLPLAEATSFTFETPPPTVSASWPNGGRQQLDVPMFVLFDQQIDAARVLAKVQVTANGQTQPLQQLSAAEVEADNQIARMVADAKAAKHDGRWLAFRTARKLPADASVQVTIPAGTPSAEGPNATTEPQRFEFRTYPPLKLEKAECGWSDLCRPRYPFILELNNPLDEDKFDPTWVSIEPAAPDAKIIAQGERLVASGAWTPRTTYKVTLSPQLLDRFGQTLGKAETRDFAVTDAEPSFFGPSGMVVLDPAADKPTYDVFTTNYAELAVQLYKVQPRDYPAYANYLHHQWDRDNPPSIPGRKVFDGTVKTSPGANQIAETKLDLAAALDGGLGHVLVFVEPRPSPHERGPRLIAWVQATKLALDAVSDGNEVQVFATELGTAKPIADLPIELGPAGTAGKTDATGLVSLPAPPASGERQLYLVAKRGSDVAMLTQNAHVWGGAAWSKQTPSFNVAWFVTDDRELYRPSEDVSLKGWMRRIDHGKGGDVTALSGLVSTVDYQVYDAQNHQLAKGTARVGALGGFDLTFTLPRTPALGHARVDLSASGTGGRWTHSHSFRIEEFRRPEFEVTASAGAGPFVVGGGGDLTASAKYFTGAPLPGADVTWIVSASPTTFTPPNRDDYTFGTWTPWWGRSHSYRDFYDEDDGFRRGARGGESSTHTAKTDAMGEHVLHLDFLSAKPSVPMSVSANATVMDVNRQAWSASTSLVVHPASRYVGIKSKRPFVEKGQPFELDLVAVDLDGKLVTGARMNVASVRLDWTYEKGAYKEQEVDAQHCVAMMATDRATCSFQTKVGGRYRVTATIVDDKGRSNESQIMYWVSGGDGPPSRDVQLEEVTLIPDQKEYAPGATAEVLVIAPFYPAEGVVMWERSGIVKTQRITLDGPTKVITVPITDALTPNVWVDVNLAGMAVRTDDRGKPDPSLPKRPAYASGQLNLAIPPKHRALAVEVKPAAAKVSPADKTSLAITVRDASGTPVSGAEVAVIVVDESILSLTGHTFASPLETFHGQRGAGTSRRFLREHVKLAKLPPTATASNNKDRREAPSDGDDESRGGNGRMVLEEGRMGKAGGEAEKTMALAKKPPPAAVMADALASTDQQSAPDEPARPIAVRSNFNPLAAFSPAVTTDASGAATVEVTMPDNLTRYRVVALAAYGDRQFGKGESSITARLPLMVRPSPPRFLNFGDTFQLPIVVQNQTDEAIQVQLAVASVNLALTDGAGRAVRVPANDRVEVQLPAAAEAAGTARLQVLATAGRYSDAAELSLPVWTPATTEAFATYGVIDSGAMAQPVALPGQVVTQFGGLEVTTASTNLQALTDAMIYLVRYPFGCAEQRSSRILAIAALRDVLEAFKVKDLPTRAEMEASIAVDLERLSQMQNGDGGFAFWERGNESWPYLTAYVTSALARAKAKGFAVPATMIERAKPYLRDIESHMPDDRYSRETKLAIGAYALSVRKQIGDLDLAKAQRLLRDAGGPEKLTMEANGWLLATMAGNATAATERAAIVRHALNKVSETAGAANFTTSYGDGAHVLLASDHRVDAVLLDALIQEQPGLDLIPKVVTGLLAGRKGGRWLNTQANTFALVALDRYFQTYEKVTPNFVARVWLGADYAGDFAFRGRTTSYFQINVPMKDVAAHDQQALTIQKDGAGRLYYRVGMKYAPASLELEAADYGFVVERSYEGLDDPEDVTRDAQGVWHIKAGARVRIRLSMVNENRRYHVALVDPLPAGLEPLNPSLATTAPLPPGTTEEDTRSRGRRGYWRWYGPWFEHQNMRDERVEAFTPELYEGVHRYDYAARATTPGTFVVPPAKAEEMYMPETFGRSASDRVIVE